MGTPLEELSSGERVRVLGGRNFEKFHGGMEGTILKNDAENKNMDVHFDEKAEKLTVAYRHLEHATGKGGYRAPLPPVAPAAAAAQAPKEPQGPLLDEHGAFKTRTLVQLQGLQSAPELNGKLGRLRKFDENAGRWEVDVRGGGTKRLKEDSLRPPDKTEVPPGLGAAELKERGNEHFKRLEHEAAAVFYTAAIELLEEGDPKPPEAEDPKYIAILHSNRAQVNIILCREVQGEDKEIGKLARGFAMRANMDAARAIELDATNGKAYYRRGCAVLGMAPSASRAKEAIYCLEIALSGRASGGKDGIVLPNAMRHEVSNLLDYAKRRLDSCVEAAVPDVEQCRENCRAQ